jgi:peroxiredoxin Q/BCP
MALKETELAPDFTIPDAGEKKVSLHYFRGKWVVVYFYPKDDTPGCTMEAMEFTKLEADFSRAGAMVLGISRDSCESHLQFSKKRNLGITLLSDADMAVQKLYGVWRPHSFMGKPVVGTVRSTFLVDPGGRIAKIWDDVNPAGHAQAVLAEVEKRKK